LQLFDAIGHGRILLWRPSHVLTQLWPGGVGFAHQHIK